MNAVSARSITWHSGLRTYLIVSGAGHLIWELGQLPLYTIFWTATGGEIAFAVMHCTGGDVLIATASLVGALIFVGDASWPKPTRASLRVAVATIVTGLAYTVFSEWLNTSVRQSWAYSDAMPILPLLGTGLGPLAQWLVIPVLALRTAGHQGRAASRPPQQ